MGKYNCGKCCDEFNQKSHYIPHLKNNCIIMDKSKIKIIN